MYRVVLEYFSGNMKHINTKRPKTGAKSNRLRYFGQNTNLHGLKYIADDKRHPLIR